MSIKLDKMPLLDMNSAYFKADEIKYYYEMAQKAYKDHALVRRFIMKVKSESPIIDDSKALELYEFSMKEMEKMFADVLFHCLLVHPSKEINSLEAFTFYNTEVKRLKDNDEHAFYWSHALINCTMNIFDMTKEEVKALFEGKGGNVFSGKRPLED